MKELGILGIEYDKKSSFLAGSAAAPKIIRKALLSRSSNAFSESGININELSVNDCGDYPVKEYFDIERLVSGQLERNRKLLIYGGDHSITYPIVKGYSRYFGDFDILHIDAHADLYDEFEGDKYSHACPFARIMEEELCDRLVQVGVRTLTSHQREQAEKFGVKIIEMKDYREDFCPRLAHPVYISLDMDVMDPSCAPGVSHPEPGGFTSRQVIDLIQRIEVPVIGADIVEYNPTRDIHNMTAMLAAKLSKEILVKMHGQ